MKSVNFVILGDASIADELGKKGSSSDITMYDRKSSEKIMTFLIPSSFPEKIQSLVQTIMLSDCAILNVKSIDKELGEQIVALDSIKMEKGFVVSNGFDEDLKNISKGTVIENYNFVSIEDLKLKIEEVNPYPKEGKAKVLIDAAFEVKGLGTVALGVVERGTVKKHDELEIFPEKRKIIVRSIQMHDDDVESVQSPGRLGIAVKGASSADLERGCVAAEKDSIEVGSELKIKFEKTKFYKQEIFSDSSYHLCIGLQIKPVKVEMGSEMIVKSEKPFAFERGERCLMIDLNSKSVRIVGSGIIL